VKKESESYLHFPPPGSSEGSIAAKIFYPLQQRFVHAEIKMSSARNGFYLYGAALCEEEKEGKVLLSPCVFMQFFEYAGKETSSRPVEADLLRSINIAENLEFYPWGSLRDLNQRLCAQFRGIHGQHSVWQYRQGNAFFLRRSLVNQRQERDLRLGRQEQEAMHWP